MGGDGAMLNCGMLLFFGQTFFSKKKKNAKCVDQGRGLPRGAERWAGLTVPYGIGGVAKVWAGLSRQLCNYGRH